MGRGQDIDGLLYGDTLQSLEIASSLRLEDDAEDDHSFSLLREFTNYIFQKQVNALTLKQEKNGVVFLDWGIPFLLHEAKADGNGDQLELLIVPCDPEVPEEQMRPKFGLYLYNESDSVGEQLYLGDSVTALCQRGQERAIRVGDPSFFDLDRDRIASLLEQLLVKIK